MSYVTDVGTAAFKKYWKDYLLPTRWSNCRVTHRRRSANDISDLVDDYDIIVVDREFTIQCGAEKIRDDRFKFGIEGLCRRNKGDILSVSTVEDFITVGEQYSNMPPFGDSLPVNKLVSFKGQEGKYLMRYEQGSLKIFRYDPGRPIEARFSEETKSFLDPAKDTLNDIARKVDRQFEKPEPIVLKVIIDYNIYSGRTKRNPKVLMVGDMYGADIVTANLLRKEIGNDAEISTCLVKSYGLLHDKKHRALVFTRIFDRFFGNIFSFCSSKATYSNSWDKELRYRQNGQASPRP